MSHIQKTPQGTYRVRWVDPASSRERSRTFPLRREAERFRVQLDGSLGDHTYVDPRKGRITLGEYAQSWLDGRTMSDARRRIAENAIRLHIVPGIGTLRLDRIASEHIQDWVNSSAKIMAAGSVRNHFEILSQILATAVSDRLITRSPVTRRGEGNSIRLPLMDHSDDRWLQPDEVDKLIVCSPDDARIMVRFLATTGLRIGEALGLRVGSIDPRRQQVTVTRQRLQDGSVGPTKTRRSRSVPLPSSTLNALQEVLKGRSRDEDLWITHLGETMQYRAFRYRWRKALKSADLGWEPTAHDLRHYYASRLVSEGVDIVRVSAYLGHATVTKTLDVYAHLMVQDHSDVSSIFE